jgi:chaperonin GroES
MSFRPLHDRVLVKRASAEQKSSGGLYIPESATEKPQEATVIAVGPGKRTDNGVRDMTVQVGDRILFGKYVGDELKLDGVDHIVLREEDILAIIEA